VNASREANTIQAMRITYPLSYERGTATVRITDYDISYRTHGAAKAVRIAKEK